MRAASARWARAVVVCARKAVRSTRWTQGSCSRPGSESGGSARSRMRRIGRLRVCQASRVKIGSGAAVALTMASKPRGSRWSWASSTTGSPRGSASSWALLRVRLATTTLNPRSGRRWARYCVMGPTPTRATEAPSGRPSQRCFRATVATLTLPSARPRRDRRRWPSRITSSNTAWASSPATPTWRACSRESFIWPGISRSPRLADSNPADIASRWTHASSPS